MSNNNNQTEPRTLLRLKAMFDAHEKVEEAMKDLNLEEQRHVIFTVLFSIEKTSSRSYAVD